MLVSNVLLLLMLISRGWIVTNAETIVAFCFIMFILASMPNIFSALAVTIGEKCEAIKREFKTVLAGCNTKNRLYLSFCSRSLSLNANIRLLSNSFTETLSLFKRSKHSSIDSYKSIQKLGQLETQTILSQLEQPFSDVKQENKGMFART